MLIFCYQSTTPVPLVRNKRKTGKGKLIPSPVSSLRSENTPLNMFSILIYFVFINYRKNLAIILIFVSIRYRNVRFPMCYLRMMIVQESDQLLFADVRVVW